MRRAPVHVVDAVSGDHTACTSDVACVGSNTLASPTSERAGRVWTSTSAFVDVASTGPSHSLMAGTTSPVVLVTVSVVLAAGLAFAILASALAGLLGHADPIWISPAQAGTLLAQLVSHLTDPALAWRCSESGTAPPAAPRMTPSGGQPERGTSPRSYTPPPKPPT